MSSGYKCPCTSKSQYSVKTLFPLSVLVEIKSIDLGDFKSIDLGDLKLIDLGDFKSIDLGDLK